MVSGTRRRRATHAGSWYDSSPSHLRHSLQAWLSAARACSAGVADAGTASPASPLAAAASSPPVYAVIAPHAGYSYSGPTAAFAYSQINPAHFSRVFILGPSHHVYLKDRCAVSDATLLDTPLGALQVDTEVVEGLLESESGGFVRMSEDMDEAEHCIEMHLPFVKCVFGEGVKVVPVVVGSLSQEKERHFGRVLSSWIGDGETFWVVSSDFCHWGARFGYTRLDRECRFVWESIERLDREGMRIIESGDHDAFSEYLRRTENTVCGRHPIAVLMSALNFCESHSNTSFSTRFIKYQQSSKCITMADSSVSYATALVQTTATNTTHY